MFTLANVGVPMISIMMPCIVIALLPIIFIEAYIIHKRLGLKFVKALRSSTKANILSTFVGIPLAWFLLHVLLIFVMVY